MSYNRVTKRVYAAMDIWNYLGSKTLDCTWGNAPEGTYENALYIHATPVTKKFWSRVLSLEIDKILTQHGCCRKYTQTNGDKKTIEFYIFLEGEP